MREEKEKKKEGKKNPLPLNKVTTALNHQADHASQIITPV